MQNRCPTGFQAASSPAYWALAAATRIADGDLTVKLESDSKDEFGGFDLAASIGKTTWKWIRVARVTRMVGQCLPCPEVQCV